jgi:hypothetical protein
MIYTLVNEIEGAASRLNIPFAKLDKNEAFEIRKQLAERFSQNKDFPLKLSWQNTVGGVFSHCVEEWLQKLYESSLDSN